MNKMCGAALALCYCGSLLASETNVLSFAYSASEAPLAERPDAYGRALNDGDWDTGGAVRFDKDVTVTIDLFVPTAVERVRVFAVTSGVTRTASTSLEASADGTAWHRLVPSSQDAGGVFTHVPLCNSLRFLRVTCQKDAAAAYQDLAEIAVTGRQRMKPVKQSFAYTPSQVANSAHADSLTAPRLADGAYQSTSGSVQFGPSSSSELTNSSPAYAVATNVTLLVDFGATVTNLTRVSLHALFPSNASFTWGTEAITVSNSADGASWELVNSQTNFTVLPGDQYGVARRFDVLLPYTTSRYLSVTARRFSSAATTKLRQLLTELEVTSAAAQTAYAAGESIPYTYTVDKATSNSHESPYAPKLTDGCYESNTRHALRFYEQEVTVTADLGYPQYLHSGFAYTWGAPTMYLDTSAGTNYYGSQQVDCYGSLDNASWTFLGSLTGKLSKKLTFAELPFARYVKATFVKFPSIGDTNVSSQIIGELTFYGVPKQTIGTLVEVPNAIPFAGFETVPPLEAATLIQGGSTNGWTFRAADAANYAGIQINGSPVSTNSVSGLKFIAPEGVQTAVMRGTNAYMEAQIAVPAAGHYLLRWQASSLVYGTSAELTGYNFRVLVDGAVKGVADVLTMSASQNQLYVGALAAGAHTLRLAALNSRNCPAGMLLDDLRLFRIPEVSEVPGSAPRSSQSVTLASTEPVTLNYVGELYLRDLVVDGQSLQHRAYSPANTPALFSGFGVIRFVDGTCLLLQ